MILTLADVTISAAASAAELAEKKKEKEQQSNSMLDGDMQHKNEKDPSLKSRDSSSVQPTKPQLVLHGGENLLHTIATTRRFVFRKGLPISVDEFTEKTVTDQWEPTWTDENIRVWALSIKPRCAETFSSSPRPQQNRKRSLDHFINGTTPTSAVSNDESSKPDSLFPPEDQSQQIRRAVVSEMFDSSWRFDALVETPLLEVLPPTVAFVRNAVTNKLERYEGPMPGSKEPVPDIKVLVRTPWPAALVDSLPPTKPSKTSMSYIIRNHRQRGKFLALKAKALKVKPGPLFRELTLGKPVQSSDGKTVFPEDVLGEGKEGGGVAVIDLPSKQYVQDLVERPEWRAPEVMAGVGAMIWILGPGVGEDETLVKFMNEFESMKHIASSQDYCPDYLSQDSAASSAIRLHLIDPVRYPVPIHNNVGLPQIGQRNLVRLSQRNLIVAKRGTSIQLEPELKIQEEKAVPHLNTALVMKDIPKPALDLAKVARRNIASPAVQKELANQNLPSPDAEIVFLGTGSALPSKYRNVSATLLRVPGSGSYLLDCGENTLGQLRRVYTPLELTSVLQDLKLIWISHLHADHHLGITSVIKAWYEAVYGNNLEPVSPLQEPSLTSADLDHADILRTEKRLFVASDSSMIKWLSEYSSVEPFGYHKVVPLSVYSAKPNRNPPIPTHFSWSGAPLSFDTPDTILQHATGLTDLAAVSVAHCWGAKAVSLTFPTGFKFSYSGDCRPCPSFCEIGKDSTVLVHEATFDDELKGDAVAKKHCTTSEALAVGWKMGAKRTLLTHFSQRYQKIPTMGIINDIRTREDKGTTTEPGKSIVIEGEEPTQEPLDDMDVDDSEAAEIVAGKKPSSSSSDGHDDHSQGAIGNPKVVKFSAFDNGIDRERAGNMKVGVAFDYMRVKVREIAELEYFTPALVSLFNSEEGREVVGGEGESESESEEKGKERGGDGEMGEEKGGGKEKRNNNKAKKQVLK